MKSYFLIFTLFSALFYSAAWSAGPNTLSCEFVDLARGKILDKKTSVINPQSTKPILLLFGVGAIMGTVRDFPGKDVFNRRIELNLDYSAGSETGHSHASSQYRLDPDSSSTLLAEVGMNGEFGQVFALRCYLQNSKAMTADFFTLLNTTTSESGHGQASGYCDGGPGSYFCMDQIQDRSKAAAVRDAEFSCRARRGNPRSYSSASCSNYCSPYSIPPNAGQQWVNCSANCTILCEIP